MRYRILWVLLFLLLCIPCSGPARGLAGDSLISDSIEKNLCLEELVVSTDRIRQRRGGYSVNIAGSGIARGKDTNGMLAMLPGLTLEEGTVMVQGRQPAAVYVDGVKVGADVLGNIPPERIVAVEVDWDAGREEMTGTRGGVIRVRTKKDIGLAGTLAGVGDYSPGYGYTGEQGTAFLSLGTRRMTVYNNAMFYHRKRTGDYEESRLMKDGGTVSLTEEDTRGWPRLFHDWLNLSYDISKNHQLGLSGLFVYDDERVRTDAVTVSAGARGGEVLTRYSRPSYMLNTQTVAMYNWAIDSLGSNLKVTADFLRRKTGQSLAAAQTADGSGMTCHKSSVRQVTDMLRVRPVWTQVMRNGSELTAGLDFRYIHFDEQTGSGLTGGIVSTAVCRTPSAFVSYSGKLGRELWYDAGVRLQYDDMTVSADGVVDGSPVRTVNDYGKWSVNPSLSLTWNFNRGKGHSLYLSCEHYVDELPYDAISSFRRYDEVNHYTVGNPLIKPMSGTSVGMTLTMFSKYSVFVRCYYDKNGIYYTNGVDPDNGELLRSMPRNARHERGLTVGAEQRLRPAGWWILKASERFMLYSGDTPDWNVSGQTHWRFSVDSDFRFGKTSGGNLHAYAEPSYRSGDQLWKTVIDVSCNAYKTFFDGKLLISLDVRPYRMGRKTVADNAFYRSERKNTTKEEYLTLAVRYSFNKGTVKRRKTAESTQEYNSITRDSP